MQDNLVLAAFALLPLVMGWLVYLFFARYRQHRHTGRRWVRLLLGNLLVLLLLLSLLLPAGEIYFRFWHDTTDSFGLTKTHQRWLSRYYHGNPNNIGVRDNVDYRRAVAAGKRRITFLGDSFTIGHGIKDVEKRFANLIRRRHPRWEVHLLAGNGYNTRHELSALLESQRWEIPDDEVQPPTDASGRLILEVDAAQRKVLGRDSAGQIVLRDAEGRLLAIPDGYGRFAKNYQLDLVVLAYCLNDIADFMPQWPSVLERIYKDSQPGWLGRHSYLINMIHYRFYAARDPDLASFSRFTLEGYDPQGSVWPAYRQRLLTLAGIVRTFGGRLLVITFPYMDQIGPGYSFRHVHKQLDQLWKETGVPHLDLLPIYEPRQEEGLVVNRYDAHPNERAHEIAAEQIERFVEAHMYDAEPGALPTPAPPAAGAPDGIGAATPTR